MGVTATISYTIQGLPDEVITFNLTGTDIADMERQMRSKKEVLDNERKVDPQNSHIRFEPNSIRIT
ncbi:MAG: hypothetical protein DLM72_15285 [Candidatus Nitrosopolaris wilkensis]|nr:MAG: hypothetical protein DLM72_15285 [Candidatus Nitrosopolaris wilkensis]